MITLTKKEIKALTRAVREFELGCLPGYANVIADLLSRARNTEQQINHQEGATKVLPPKQDYNYGCNAARYPYN